MMNNLPSERGVPYITIAIGSFSYVIMSEPLVSSNNNKQRPAILGAITLSGERGEGKIVRDTMYFCDFFKYFSSSIFFSFLS